MKMRREGGLGRQVLTAEPQKDLSVHSSADDIQLELEARA